jgi:uncharacterized protein (TIGR00369 family)
MTTNQKKNVVGAIRTPITLEQLIETLKDSPFTQLLKTEVIACQDGYAELKIPFSNDLKQHTGFTHGAVLGFAADSACCWAAASKVGNVVTAEYKINFICPAVGDFIIGKGYVIKSTMSQVVSRADIYSLRRGKENLVATALATIATY